MQQCSIALSGLVDVNASEGHRYTAGLETVLLHFTDFGLHGTEFRKGEQSGVHAVLREGHPEYSR